RAAGFLERLPPLLARPLLGLLVLRVVFFVHDHVVFLDDVEVLSGGAGLAPARRLVLGFRVVGDALAAARRFFLGVGRNPALRTRRLVTILVGIVADASRGDGWQWLVADRDGGLQLLLLGHDEDCRAARALDLLAGGDLVRPAQGDVAFGTRKGGSGHGHPLRWRERRAGYGRRRNRVIIPHGTAFARGS